MPNQINVYPNSSPIQVRTETASISVTPQTVALGIYSPAGPVGPPGPAGAGLLIKGTVSTSANLPTTGNVYSDLWIAQDTGHGWVWESPGVWSDIGMIEGAPGPAGVNGENPNSLYSGAFTPPVGAGTSNLTIIDASSLWWASAGLSVYVEAINADGTKTLIGYCKIVSIAGNVMTVSN
jgi:hypothetical protein